MYANAFIHTYIYMHLKIRQKFGFPCSFQESVAKTADLVLKSCRGLRNYQYSGFIFL